MTFCGLVTYELSCTLSPTNTPYKTVGDGEGVGGVEIIGFAGTEQKICFSSIILIAIKSHKVIADIYHFPLLPFIPYFLSFKLALQVVRVIYLADNSQDIFTTTENTPGISTERI